MDLTRMIEGTFSKVNATVFRQVNRATDWWNLPTPVALLNLRAHRDDLREHNLYDTEAPRENGGAATEDLPAVPHLRRLAPGPDRPEDGHGRQPLRPQRADRRDRARAAARADAAEPARGRQPAAAAARVHPRDQPQRARGLLDPVPEPRLVRPRRERARHLHRHRARRERRVARGHADAHAGDQPRPHPDLDSRACRRPTSTPSPTGGTSRRSTARPRSATASCARARTASSKVEDGMLPNEDRPEARRRRPDRLLRQLLDRALAPAHAVRQGAQLDLRPPQGRLSDLGRRAALPHRAAGQLGAEREDPHGRVDARDPRQPGARAGDERELVRDPAALGAPEVRPRRHRDDRRHRRLRAGAPRGAVRDHRGVRLRLPAAPAAPRRLRDPRPRDRRAGRRDRLRADPGPRDAPDDPRARLVEPPLLVRRRPPRARSRCATTRRRSPTTCA